MNSKYDNPGELLEHLISTLYENGIQKTAIASLIGIKGADLTDLQKLCNGKLKSHNGKTTSEYIDLIYKNTDFAEIISKKSINFTLFDKLFFLYYWSSKNQIGVAFLGINEKEITKSTFSYLKRNEAGAYVIEKKNMVASFEYEDRPTLEIILKKTQKNVSTFLSAHIGSTHIEDVKLTFCSYCGAMSSNHINYAGIGILEQIPKQDFISYWRNLNENKISPSIINALYMRRLDLETSETDVYEIPE